MNKHGGDVYSFSKQLQITLEDCIDFSANINPIRIPDEVIQGMYQGISQVHNYPDISCGRLRNAIAKKVEISPEMIFCGNGAADIVYRTCFARKPKKALLAEPCFAEYREALHAQGAQISSYVMKEDLKLKEDFCEWITEDIDMIFLCNPGNPTGLLIEHGILKNILKKAREISAFVVLDECFMDFLPNYKEISMQSYLGQYDNFCILRSFTKMFSIPGIRLGYTLSANKTYLEALHHAGPPWSVNAAAQEAGIAACEQQEHINKTAVLIEKERQFLKKELRQCGFYVYDGQANYLLFRTEGMTDLYERFLPYRILIRRCSNYVGLDPCFYRIAVKSHEDNIRLVHALKEIMQKRGESNAG